MSTIHRLRAWLALVAVTFVALVALAGPAAAQAVEDGEVPVPDGIILSTHWVQLLVGFALPLVTGLLLRTENPGWLKVGVAGGVTAVANTFTQALLPDGTAFLSEAWFVQALILFATSVFTYARVWNPVLERRGGVNAATPNLVALPAARSGPRAA